MTDDGSLVVADQILAGMLPNLKTLAVIADEAAESTDALSGRLPKVPGLAARHPATVDAIDALRRRLVAYSAALGRLQDTLRQT